MKFKSPHWLTIVIGTLALVCMSLQETNTFPSLNPAFSVVKYVATALSIPTIAAAGGRAAERGFVLVGDMFPDAIVILVSSAFGLAVAAIIISCTPSQTKVIAKVEPIIANGVCQIANDQGSAEPGWEILVCNTIDPSGRASLSSLSMKLPASAADGLVKASVHPLPSLAR